jgi:triacylglycerol esterase/lipase EstA (alpha/beta hydrolase family)
MNPHRSSSVSVRSARAWARTGALLLSSALATACATSPVGVKHLDMQTAYLRSNVSALYSSEVSESSRNVLRRHDLLEMYAEEPARALARLRDDYLEAAPDMGVLYALAELSFAHALSSGSKPYYMAAAIYAYALLLPPPSVEPFRSIDPRIRAGIDIYNEALVGAFAGKDGKTLVFASEAYALPWGRLTVAFDEQQLVWRGLRLTDFLPASRFEVTGLRNNYRRPGIGTPLIPRAEPPSEEAAEKSFMVPNVRIPVTALLIPDDVHQTLGDERMTARLELYLVDESPEIMLEGKTVPLEARPTVALAQTLVDLNPYQYEIAGLMGKVLGHRKTARLIALEPASPSRIPVVLVHGTASSGARWADMLNDIEADPELRDRFQFWFFGYDSGNPILYSGLLLRNALTQRVAAIDPTGTNACISDMIVIGHSQGGLLTKLVAVDSGTAFWDAITDKPFDEVSLSEDSRALLKSGLFFEAPSFVKRVVFIATPHRGSYLAGSGFARRLAEWLITLPAELTRLSADSLHLHNDPAFSAKLGTRVTSIDNMSPGSRPLRVLGRLPVKPGIASHSIIAVKAGMDPVEDGNDGVVEYRSAHLDGVESELVVRSRHSTQSNPNTINEVVRILKLHAAQSACAPMAD